MITPYDIELLRHAAEFSWYSPDPSTKNGAILIDPWGKLIHRALNEYPKGTTTQPSKTAKLLRIEHAERNAIYGAARLGKTTQGSTMYCPFVACTDCARAIVICGVKRVVYSNKCIEKADNHWWESIKVGFEMMKGAGVLLEGINSIDTKIWFRNGELLL